MVSTHLMLATVLRLRVVRLAWVATIVLVFLCCTTTDVTLVPKAHANCGEPVAGRQFGLLWRGDRDGVIERRPVCERRGVREGAREGRAATRARGDREATRGRTPPRRGVGEVLSSPIASAGADDARLKGWRTLRGASSRSSRSVIASIGAGASSPANPSSIGRPASRRASRKLRMRSRMSLACLEDALTRHRRCASALLAMHQTSAISIRMTVPRSFHYYHYYYVCYYCCYSCFYFYYYYFYGYHYSSDSWRGLEFGEHCREPPLST